MLQYFSTFILAALTSQVLAMESLDLIIPAKPGGYAHTQAETLKKIAASQGVSIEIKFTGTCQNAARIWQQDPTAVVLLATHIAADTRCGFGEIEKYNIITYLQHMPMMMCYRRDRTELGLAHFTDTRSRKTLGVISYMQSSMDQLMKPNGHTAAKVMSVGISSDLRAATFLNEIDYFLLDPDYVSKHAGRMACMANTTRFEVMDTASLDKILPQWDRNEIYVSHMIASKSPASVKLKTMFTSIINSETWTEYLASQPGLRKSSPDGDHYRFYNQQRKIFSR